MKRFFHKRHTTQAGIAHLAIPLAIIIILAVGYTGYRLIQGSSAAASAQPITTSAGQCLDNRANVLASGNRIQIWSCNNRPQQKWQLMTNGTIQNQGYCLDVAGAGTKPGTIVRLFSCNNTVAQTWSVKDNGTIVNPHSGLCLDNKGNSTANGNTIWIYTCNGMASQQWKISTSAPTGPTPTPTPAPTPSPTPAPTPTPTPTPAPSGSGFITRSGQTLMLAGKKFQFVGFDAYGMTGCANGRAWTTAQLDTYFGNMPANGVTRLWAYHSYGTGPIQTILTEAAKYHQHVILSLGDDDSSCGDTDGSSGGNKTADFYNSGWKGTYLTWVNTIVPMFKNNTSVAMWEIANEPGQAGAQPTKAYFDGTSAAIKADDPNHLVETGINDNANLGGQANYVSFQSSSNIDVISFHDYSYEYENKAVVSGHFNDAKAAAQADNKAFIAGEAGVTAGNGCSVSLATRASFLNSKAQNYLNNGAAGIAFWDYEPAQPAGCYYDINASDPLINLMKNFNFPG